MNRGNVFIYSVVKTQTLENVVFSRVFAFRTQWINGLFFRVLIAICKIFGAFNQIRHDLIELRGVF